MTRLFVLVGYLYQSVAAVALIFAVSHLIDNAAYTTFSLVAALSQLIAVLAFEWLQIAGTRFLAGADPDERLRLRSSVLSAFALSAAALVVAGPIALHFTAVPPVTAALALGAALAQGLADLMLMIVRVDGRLAMSAGLLVFRATCLVVMAALAAWLHRSAEAVLAGMLIGQGLGFLAAVALDRSLIRWSRRDTRRADLAAFCRYGMQAAAASVMHLSVTVLVRFAIVGRLGVASVEAAGFSLAFDLLQRPFSVLVAAVHMVSFPEVVAKYDRAPREEARAATARLFEFLLCTTLVLLGGMVAFIPEVAWIFVPQTLLPAFIAVVPAVSLFAFVNTHLQVTGAVVVHLLKMTQRLVIVAFGQLAAVPAIVWLMLAAGQSISAALTLASLATVAWMVAMAGPTLRFGAYPKPLLVIVATVGASLIGALVWLPSLPVAWLAAKIVLAAAVTGLVAWRGDFLRLARAGAS